MKEVFFNLTFVMCVCVLLNGARATFFLYRYLNQDFIINLSFFLCKNVYKGERSRATSSKKNI